MHKIFLSHSSKDKPYVSYIANQFGKDHCTYDAACFEVGLKNLDEIFHEMDKSSIFVVFLSNNSLQSEWVTKELSIAEERLHHDKYKLSQIFPIIIDPSITHNDPRIPAFLKQGFGSYNLRVITSEKVAYRKIKAQQTKLLMENHSFSQPTCFYGRDQEISHFKSKFDSGEQFKCIVASGLTGIGRKSFLLECLKRTQIIEEYYTPPTISLNGFESIEDFIVKLSQVGFGDYALEDVALLPDMESKISVLSELLSTIQQYREQVVVYDDNCLVDRRGDLAYWFTKALVNIRPEVTITIAARNNVNVFCLRKNPVIYSASLSTLPPSEWLGLMRIYAKSLGIELCAEDRNYFKDIITGYPPQVLFCVDLIHETSIEEVKDNPRPIIDNFSPKITHMLETAIPADIKDDAYGLLAFVSSYGTVPSDLMQLILNIKAGYKQAFSLFKTLTICKYLGISNEYMEINPLVSDYIQRGRFPLPADIQKVLQSRLDYINNIVDSGESTVTEDFEDLKFYLKSNIVKGSPIPDRFMYSTLYMSSIYDLYNKQRYSQVINIVEKLKETRTFYRYDMPVQSRIQSYYCRSLARETNPKFYTEVEFFKHNSEAAKQIEYDFLRGFMYRHESKYDKALVQYQKVLSAQNRHRSAMREIVTVYRGLEDYESAYEYAKANYLREPDNLYQIQPYFEILIRKNKSERTEEETGHIQDMLNTVSRINQSNPNTTYYEMMGQYAAFEENDQCRALAVLEEAHKKFPDSSYVVKYLFDCSELFSDIETMQSSLEKLELYGKSNKAARVAFNIRQTLFFAYQKKPRDFIFNAVDAIAGITAETKTRLKRKISSILRAP